MVRVARVIVSALALASVACSLLLSYDEYDRDFGAPGDGGADGGEASLADAGVNDAPSADAGDASDANACTTDAEPTCPVSTDLQADIDNCGVCGRRCLSTSPKCNLGTCDVEAAFWFPYVQPIGITLDDNYFYGIGLDGIGDVEGGVARGAKTGSAGNAVLAFYTADPRRMAVHGNDVYWTERDGIAHSPNATLPDGAANRTELVVPGQVSAFNIAVDDLYVYWTNKTPGADVWRASKATPSDAKPIAQMQNVYGLAVDADYVYYTENVQGGGVWRASKDGSNAMKVADGQSFPADLFVDGEAIYWTNASSSGAVMKLPKGSTVPIALASGRDHPNRISAKSLYVYWFEAGASKQDILRVSKCGGTPLRLATGQDVTDLAVEDTRVYWATGAVINRVTR